MPIRIASFNVENLFARPKVFNFRDKLVGSALLKRIGAFDNRLKKRRYTDEDKTTLVAEFNRGDPQADKQPLKNFITIREDRGKLWKKRGRGVVGVQAEGRGDWDGAVEFRKASFSTIGRENTGKVIRSVKADVACIVEADSRATLQSFDTHVLNSKYRYEMLIDGNDKRGIDVGLYSRFPLGRIQTHMFDGTSRSRTFSRDCPEYELHLPDGKRLHMLCNHFKSKGFDYGGTADARRKRQAQAVADILGGYDLDKDWVVVAGDLNDTPTSAPLRPLMSIANLHDVLEMQYPDAPAKRWTYRYKRFEQIDYLLVSEPLKERFIQAGVQRKGIYDLKRLTAASDAVDDETQYRSVTHWSNAASDHGAVWAEFDV